MSSKRYKAAWAKIGSASGFRLGTDFFKDHPEFTGAKGEVEVVASDALLVRLQPQSSAQDDDEEELMLSLFLNFLMGEALSNPDEVEAYTAQMADEDDELTAGVVLDH